METMEKAAAEGMVWRRLRQDYPWDELEVEDIQVLPDEVLGWLLLRRASLRLAVQSSGGCAEGRRGGTLAS